MEVDAAAPVAPFVQQLFKLVHEGLHVAWAADGAALVIPDTQRFAADRCPVYFKHSNWTSFARMLNMYEFRRRKSADGSAIFAHPHFTRGGAPWPFDRLHGPHGPSGVCKFARPVA